MIKIFISSVQDEFAEERMLLKAYIEKSPLLRRFFSVFVFEADVPPTDRRTDEVYFEELRNSDLCLFLIGKRYGGLSGNGISPTEREYDEATGRGIQRLAFVRDELTAREPREQQFLSKVSKDVTWHSFGDTDALLNWVLAALDKVMEQRCLFRTLPFDKSPCQGAKWSDLNEDRIRWFVKKARRERNFALSEDAPTSDVLTHLRLVDEAGTLTNAALLLFGKEPQRWHLTSEVKCVHWHGVQRVKPIRSYKVYKGTLFDMADQAVEFVMAKLDYSVGIRNHGPEVDRDYEIPEEVVSEAIINAIAHRDYLSTGSIQVELFADRLEIYNPGSINPALTPEKLTKRHGSFPNNPLIAEPLYLTKYIERLGSGLTDLIEHCRAVGLPDPEFHVDRFEFGLVIRRKGFGGVNDPVNAKSRPANEKSRPANEKSRPVNIKSRLANSESRPANEKSRPVNADQELCNEDVAAYLLTKGVRKDLRENMVSVFLHIAGQPNLSYDALSMLTHLPRTVVRTSIAALKEYRLLKRIGSDKTGHWQTFFPPKGV